MSKCLMCDVDLGSVDEGHVCWICYEFGELVKRIRKVENESNQDKV